MNKIMIGTITIDNIELKCIIGVRDEERDTPQRLRLKLELDYDIRAAARSANLSDALDYSKATSSVVDFVCDGRFELLETLVYRVVYYLHEQYPQCLRIRVTAAKPDALRGIGVPSVSAEEVFSPG